MWLMVLAYAKKKSSRVAFISDDGTFQGGQGSLNETLADDLTNEKVEVSYYGGISAFIARNSLQTEELSEEEFFTLVRRELVDRKAKEAFEESESFWGATEKVDIDTMEFVSAKKFKVAKESFYVEGALTGKARFTIVQQQPWRQYPFTIGTVAIIIRRPRALKSGVRRRGRIFRLGKG